MLVFYVAFGGFFVGLFCGAALYAFAVTVAAWEAKRQRMKIEDAIHTHPRAANPKLYGHKITTSQP